MINTEPHIHENVVCANIFIRKDKKYVMLKRSEQKKYAPGFVHPFGGKLDPNENPYLGAQREVLEECGIKLKDMKLEAVILEITPHKGMKNDWLIFHFSADYESGEIEETEEGEILYLTNDEILKQNLFPSVRAIITNILNPNDGTVFATFAYDENGEIDESQSNINICKV